MPRGNLEGTVSLSASQLPPGVTASFSPASTAGASTMTLTANTSTAPGTTSITITGTSGSLSRTTTTAVTVTPVASGTIPVDLSSAYNLTGIYDDGSKFPATAGLDSGGFAFSEDLLGSEQVGDGVVFKLGPPNVPDVVTGRTISLPSEKSSSLKVLAVAVNGHQELQNFTVTYADGTSSTFTQSLSDWAYPGNFSGESVAFSLPYRLTGDGSKDSRAFYAYAYSFGLDRNKVIQSVSLPSNPNVLIFALTLVPAK
jgi:alpha-mannosidase